MPFIPTAYPTGTVFDLGRRVKLGPKSLKVQTAPALEARTALDLSSYSGDTAEVTCNGDYPITLQGGEHGIVIRSDAQSSDVLFIWRDMGNVECALARGIPAEKFVTQRGRPRFAGEPMPSATGDVQSAAAIAPAKAATSQPPVVTQPDVADALETLRQALQPKATVDEAAVRAIVEDAIEPLRQLLQSPAVAQSRARLAVAQASSSNPIMAALQQRYVVGQEAPANALLVAPPSLGKSFTIREFGKQYDLFLEHGCTDDLDEVATLLGGPVATGAGFEVVDGVLTQAVRAASQGQTVLLLLDEVLRMGDRPQESLLSFLTGVKTQTGRVYRLRTRRFENGAFETIECPVANLHIVAAANLGARHPQEAFWSRWDVVRFGFDLATVEGVASTVAQSYGISEADMVGKRYAAAVSMSRALVASNAVRYPLDIRTLERACQLAGSDKGSEVLTYVASRVSDSCAHWSIDLGETDPSCSSAVDAIKTCLLTAN
jgi:hypothetical protein